MPLYFSLESHLHKDDEGDERRVYSFMSDNETSFPMPHLTKCQQLGGTVRAEERAAVSVDTHWEVRTERAHSDSIRSYPNLVLCTSLKAS